MTTLNYAQQLKNINPPQEKFIAFLDILGFSEFIKNNEHRTAIEKYQCMIRPMIDLSLTETAEQITKDSSWIEEVSKSDNYDNLEPKFDNVILQCGAMSDSVLLSTPDNTLRSLIILLATVRNLMAKLFFLGFPLRGAITSGWVTIDNQTPSSPNLNHHLAIGKPIVEAVDLEKKQKWSGCALHLSVTDCIGPAIVKLDPTLITLYEVPLKDGVKLMPVVNWLNGISDDEKNKFNDNSIASKFEMHNKKITEKEQDIIKNTISFFNHVEEKSLMNI
ncbi:hypothetical protein TUM19329_01780 [Legionella antarctica]|uniref:Guanylate cyclase domain-containing protein n=1 Tax=Legionella antarctica TaxID=2708020 RepID=A0A6F8T0W4_9GAMM|nr:hypothetical protein [Legionella antarctica]BCA93817.1 hypothetical protein TUM19329_01780 [Legionella antarctica]